jgi:hypothetical protein
LSYWIVTGEQTIFGNFLGGVALCIAVKWMASHKFERKTAEAWLEMKGDFPAVRSSKEFFVMCDYSLHLVASRPAQVGDRLISTRFSNALTRGFAAEGQPAVAVCLLPGTEVTFERDAECQNSFRLFRNRNLRQKVARFRQIDLDRPTAHHDALEFPDGQIVLVTNLIEGQRATVLQLPASVQARSKAQFAEGTPSTPVA